MGPGSGGKVGAGYRRGNLLQKRRQMLPMIDHDNSLRAQKYFHFCLSLSNTVQEHKLDINSRQSPEERGVPARLRMKSSGRRAKTLLKWDAFTLGRLMMSRWG